MILVMAVVGPLHGSTVNRLLFNDHLHGLILRWERRSMHPVRVMKAGRIRTSEQV